MASKSPLKILMVHPHDLWYDPWTTRILNLARSLRQRGHTVTLCHLPRKDRPAHQPLRGHQPDDPPVHALRPRQQHLWYNYKLLRSLAEGCDILHLQKCFAATALPLLWVARNLGIPLHYDWDDYETAITRKVEKRALSRLQLRVYEKQLPHFAHTLTYASQAIKELALATGFHESRMAHLPVGADTTCFKPDVAHAWVHPRFGLDPNKLTVLYIGQLEGAAHASHLIAAAPYVISEAPGTQFLFVGGGKQLGQLRKSASDSPASKAIHIAGYLPSDQIPAIVAAADICVACFDQDAASAAKSPLKIAEYLASGKPIVTRHVGDAPWMVDGCGISVTPANAKALAKGILTYANNPEKRDHDAQRARQRAESHFTWNRGADTLEQIYSRALNA